MWVPGPSGDTIDTFPSHLYAIVPSCMWLGVSGRGWRVWVGENGHSSCVRKTSSMLGTDSLVQLI